MEYARLRECLASDLARLREVAGGVDGTAPVPTCPGWTVTDLVGHVALVYLHKVECMVHGVRPPTWPPADLAEEARRQPLDLLDRAYRALTHEFDTRLPNEPADGWFEPDRTVGFWIRRMAHETLIHRIDAELAAGAPLAPVPDDLAVDGLDEFLYVFVVYGTTAWPEEARAVLAAADGQDVRLVTTGGVWLVRPTTGGVRVSEDPSQPVATEVSGAPADLLRWVWGRAGDDAVAISGDRTRVEPLRAIFRLVAQ
jgi:uncharacterized Actinobacterial protein TIGR03083